MREWKAHNGPLEGLSYDTERKILITTGHNKKLKFWDPFDGEPGVNARQILTINRVAGEDLCFFSDEGNEFVCHEDREIVTYRLYPSQVYRNIPIRATGFVESVDIHPQKRRLLITMDDQIGVWDVKRRQAEWSYSNVTSVVTSYYNSTGQFTYGIGFRQMGTRHATDGKQMGNHIPHVEFEGRCTRMSRRGTFAASVLTNQVGMFRLKAGGVIVPVEFSLEYPSPAVLDLSSDGTWLAAVGHAEEEPIVVDVTTHARQTLPLASGNRGRSTVRFSHDSRLLVVGTRTQYHVYQLVNGAWQRSKSLEIGSKYPVVAFSQDDSLLALADSDSTVTLVTMPGGVPVLQLRDRVGRSMRDFCFGPDDGDLYIAGEGGVRHWNLALIRKELAKYEMSWD